MTNRIFIVDDDEFLTQMYRLTLNGPDRAVEIYHDGEAVLAAVEAGEPGILVLDLLMPKLDGFGVLQKLKDKGCHFPIIILSNVGGTVDQEKCRALGATDFYNKSSTDLEGLAAMVSKYLPA
ncbi:MAG: winged helix family two component transcriptional regulator [Candidatus Peribacteria bacterium]|nr:winged helix family two component transcriptional regulator [Candidatus Peribacteria bacterium]